MKKAFYLILAFTLLFCFSSCGETKNRTENVNITVGKSEKYSEKDLNDAVKAAVDYFDSEFEYCTLTDIWYDDNSQENVTDGEIILLSNFDTNAFASREGFESNSTYSSWKWSLMKDASGNWTVINYGYA